MEILQAIALLLACILGGAFFSWLMNLGGGDHPFKRKRKQ